MPHRSGIHVIEERKEGAVGARAVHGARSKGDENLRARDEHNATRGALRRDNRARGELRAALVATERVTREIDGGRGVRKGWHALVGADVAEGKLACRAIV